MPIISVESVSKKSRLAPVLGQAGQAGPIVLILILLLTVLRILIWVWRKKPMKKPWKDLVIVWAMYKIVCQLIFRLNLFLKLLLI